MNLTENEYYLYYIHADKCIKCKSDKSNTKTINITNIKEFREFYFKMKNNKEFKYEFYMELMKFINASKENIYRTIEPDLREVEIKKYKYWKKHFEIERRDKEREIEIDNATDGLMMGKPYVMNVIFYKLVKNRLY